VFVSYLNLLGPPSSELLAYDAATGTLLFNAAVPVTVGPPTPANRAVFLGTGNIRTGAGGGISAYRLP
jgi:outer membrane protein assembly factor BamB